MQYIYSD